ncbi:hypothetical protein Tsubulata_050899 [Turnera subulata]|uniref:MADS-box domain-containing protein n=1 Tax=Turnera subulata TaxID=218843 RepID=A0A9Q0FFC6_9ROSI|nr:hypothetical protein Tsubulata_050899 [Turnera subulata]
MDATDMIIKQQQEQQQQQQQQRIPSKGRQKIELKKVEKQSSRYVTFSKRKKGMFRKAAELSTLCGAQVAILIFSEHGRIFKFGQPADADDVLQTYLAAETSGGDNNINNPADYDDRIISWSKEKLQGSSGVGGGQSNVENNGGFWWELPVEGMDMSELEAFVKSLKELKKNVVTRIELMGGNSDGTECGIINQFINHSETDPSNLVFPCF